MRADPNFGMIFFVFVIACACSWGSYLQLPVWVWYPFAELTQNKGRCFCLFSLRRFWCPIDNFSIPRLLLTAFTFDFLPANQSQQQISLESCLFFHLGSSCYDDLDFEKLNVSFLFLSLFLSLSFFLSLSLCASNLFLIYLSTNPSAQTGYDTRSIFKRGLTGLNSEFFFS